MYEKEKLEYLIAKVKRLSRKMDIELAKSPQEWDRVNDIIVESAKLEVKSWRKY